MNRRDKTLDSLIILIYITVYIMAICYQCRQVFYSGLFSLGRTVSSLAIIALCMLYCLYKLRYKLDGIVYGNFMLYWFLLTILHEGTITLLLGVISIPKVFYNIILWPILTLVFFDYSKEYELPSVFKPITVIGMIMVCVAAYLAARVRMYNYDGQAAFMVYFVLAFIPMVYYICSKKASFLFSFINMLLMILISKRTGLMIAILGFLSYSVCEVITAENIEYKKKMLCFLIIGCIMLTVSALYIIQETDLRISARLEALFSDEDDTGSGRTLIWDHILRSYYASSFLIRLFGHGFHAVFYRIYAIGDHIYAHNSYIEYLYDFGIIGVFLLIVFVLKIIFSTIKMIAKREKYASIMVYTVIAMLFLSMFSYFFEEAVMVVPFCVIWGICLGRFESDKLKESMQYPQRQYKYIKYNKAEEVEQYPQLQYKYIRSDS